MQSDETILDNLSMHHITFEMEMKKGTNDRNMEQDEFFSEKAIERLSHLNPKINIESALEYSKSKGYTYDEKAIIKFANAYCRKEYISYTAKDVVHNGLLKNYVHKIESIKPTNELDYWKTRCLLAEKYISESPCDPDITKKQVEALQVYNKFIEENPEP